LANDSSNRIVGIHVLYGTHAWCMCMRACMQINMHVVWVVWRSVMAGGLGPRIIQTILWWQKMSGDDE
jgi:hypothetical protein